MVSFIAVQQSAFSPAALPVAAEADGVIGLEDTQVSLRGVQEGAKVQLYNAARPYAVLHEEIAVAENFDGNGNYIVDFGQPFENVESFWAVQITGGGDRYACAKHSWKRFARTWRFVVVCGNFLRRVLT